MNSTTRKRFKRSANGVTLDAAVQTRYLQPFLTESPALTKLATGRGRARFVCALCGGEHPAGVKRQMLVGDNPRAEVCRMCMEAPAERS